MSVEAPAALPAGTRVAEFEIRRVLGSGGFGIVYLAWDHALEREVALKEYMPGTLAGRGEGLQISVRSQSTADTFALGLRSFINEARLLARFDHPSLVKVYRFWEDNGTAYMVMPYYQGRTLRQARRGMVVPPGEAACRRVLDGVLSALDALHREGVYHRDIAPDNILLGDDGLPVLLDFGAARHVLGDRTQALTSIMKPHYAPLEQYADANSMRQGPWTDLYALGGTMYFLITGQEPVAAASRALHDDQPRLAELRPRDCTAGFLAAIDWMLALKPPERPQSVQMLRDVLDGRIALPGRIAADKTLPGVAARDRAAAEARSSFFTDFDPSEGADEAAAALAATAANAAAPTVLQGPVTAPPVAPTVAQHEPASAHSVHSELAARQPPRLVGLLGALILLNLLAWWWFTRTPQGAPSLPPAARAAVVQPASPALQPTAAMTGGAMATPMPSQTAPVRSPVQDVDAKETVLSVMPARAPVVQTQPVPEAATSRQPPAAGDVAPRSSETGAAVAAVARVRPNDASTTGATTAAGGTAAGTAPSAINATAGPRARCGERNFLSMLICVKRECENPALQGHPECVKLREQEEGLRARRQ
jgi:Protein kinase domain